MFAPRRDTCKILRCSLGCCLCVMSSMMSPFCELLCMWREGAYVFRPLVWEIRADVQRREMSECLHLLCVGLGHWTPDKQCILFVVLDMLKYKSRTGAVICGEFFTRNNTCIVICRFLDEFVANVYEPGWVNSRGASECSPRWAPIHSYAHDPAHILRRSLLCTVAAR